VGAQEPSTRLRLMLHHGDPVQLGRVLLMLGQHDVRLAGLLAEPVDAEGHWPVTLRVRTIYAEPLLHELRAMGVRVEEPSETAGA